MRVQCKACICAVLKVSGLAEFDNAVKGWLGAVEETAAKATVELAKQTLGMLLQGSPQYSGDFAASWRVGYGHVDRTYEQNRFSDDVFSAGPFQQGSRKAIDFAQGNAKWRPLKLGEHIYISNSATHEEPYAWKIESGQIKFRAVNSGSEHLVRRTVTFLGNIYQTLGKPQLGSMKVF